MLNQMMLLLLDMVLWPYIAILLLRFHFSWLRVPMRNLLGEFVMILTDFLVLPLRKKIPPLGRFDLATLLLALFAQTLLLIMQAAVGVAPLETILSINIALLVILKLLTMSIYLLIIALIAQAILSWINPHHTSAALLNNITHPFLAPIRKIVPLIGGRIDLSPLVLLIICNLILIPLGNTEILLLSGVL